MRSVGLVVVAVMASLLSASSAGAATVTTLSRCYQERGDVVASGSGYAPNSIVTVTRNGRDLGSATTDAQGGFTRKFTTPKLPHGTKELGYLVVATDGTNSALTRYRATKLLANFSPSAGNLATLLVRFRVRGFNLLEPRSGVFLHYVRPNGKVRRTIRLGTARGTCGHIRQTRRRHLMPFDAERGQWTLQFDTRKKYTRPKTTSTFVWVRRRVRVYAAAG